MNKYSQPYRRQQVIPPTPAGILPAQPTEALLFYLLLLLLPQKYRVRKTTSQVYSGKHWPFGAHRAPGPAGSSGDLPPGATLVSGVPVAPLPNFLGWKKSFLLPVKETQRLLRGSCCQRESSRLFIPHGWLPRTLGLGQGRMLPGFAKTGLVRRPQSTRSAAGSWTIAAIPSVALLPHPAFAQLWAPRLKTKAHQHNYSHIGLSFK